MAKENDILDLVSPSPKSMHILHSKQIPKLIYVATHNERTLKDFVEILFQYNKMWFDTDSEDTQLEIEDHLDDVDRGIETKKDKPWMLQLLPILTEISE